MTNSICFDKYSQMFEATIEFNVGTTNNQSDPIDNVFISKFLITLQHLDPQLAEAVKHILGKCEFSKFYPIFMQLLNELVVD